MDDNQPWKSWRQIGRSVAGEGLWHEGIFSIVNLVNGRGYVASTRNVGKRVWDQRDRLTRSTHPCPPLQADWKRSPTDFQFFLVQRVNVSWLLPFWKDHWVKQFGSDCYNLKAAMPRVARPRCRKLVAVESGLLAAYDALAVAEKKCRSEALAVDFSAFNSSAATQAKTMAPDFARRKAEAALHFVNQIMKLNRQHD